MEQTTQFPTHNKSTADSRQDSPPWQERSIQIQRGARDALGAMDEVIVDLERSVRTQMQQRPYVTLSAAAGVGYVLGGGLAARLTRTALGIGARLASAIVAQALSARLTSDSISTTNTTNGGSR